MATSTAENTLRFIRTLATEHSERLADRQLLQRFLAERDEAAFAALVRRHGPMVLGVCRRILQHDHDAEDVFQATFLVLARWAGAVRCQESVGSWLFGVAYRLAHKARLSAARRLSHESRAGRALSADPLDELSSLEAKALLDRELARLPEKYRAPLILCGLQGLARAEAARQLGVPLVTFKSRLEQARQRLRTRLTAQGLAVSGALGAFLAGEWSAGAALPLPLAHTTSQAATAFAQGITPAVPARLFTLVQAALRPALVARRTLAVVAALLLGATGIGLAVSRPTADEAPTPPHQPVLQAAAPKPAAKERPRVRATDLLHEALKELQGQEDLYRIRTLATVAVLQARLGDRDGARDTVRQARAALDALPPESRLGQVREVLTADARTTSADEARAVAKSLPEYLDRFPGANRDFRDYALQDVALALGEAGHVKTALTLVDAMADPDKQGWVRPHVYSKAALALAREGKVREAVRAAEAVPDEGVRVEALAGILYQNYSFSGLPHEPGVAQSQAKAGDRRGARRSLVRAEALARGLKDEQQRARYLATVACAWAQYGDISAALAATKDVGALRWQVMALAGVARQQAAAGQKKEAQTTVDGIHDAAARAHALYNLALGLAQGGDRKAAARALDRARELVQTLPQEDRDLHLHNLATAQATAGDVPGALRLTRLMNPGNVAMTTRNVLYGQARSGDMKGALRNADELLGDSAFFRGSALRGIAREQTERGDEARALAWARKRTAATDRANALLGVAEGLLRRAGQPR
jgi:RNA polymerase sigma factor (sigma-70 family)